MKGAGRLMTNGNVVGCCKETRLNDVEPCTLEPSRVLRCPGLAKDGGGGAGLFSSILGSWLTGEMGSQTTIREIAPWM